MKIVLILPILILTSSCLTYRWEARLPDSVVDEIEEMKAENEKKNSEKRNGYIELKGEFPRYLTVWQQRTYANQFLIKNTSKELVYVSYKSSVIVVAGTSHRVISGETIGMNRDRDSADTPIAPESTASISLFTPDDSISNLLRSGAEGVTYKVAIRKTNNSSDFITIIPKRAEILNLVSKNLDGVQFTTKAGSWDRIGCYVTGIMYGGWCWLVSPREEDILAADKIAKKKLKDTRAIAEYQGRE